MICLFLFPSINTKISEHKNQIAILVWSVFVIYIAMLIILIVRKTNHRVVYYPLSLFTLIALIFNVGVIYIGEYDLQELEDDFNSGKDIDTSKLWTKTTWTKWVKDYIADNYKNEVDIDKILNDDEFIEYLALDCLNNADWQDLSTLLNEYEYNNDWVYDNWEWYQKDRKK